MGCAGMGKTAIVSLNSSFLLLSLGLLVIGLLVQYNQDILNDILGIVTDMLKNSLESLNTMKETADHLVKGPNLPQISPDNIKTMIKELLENISRPLIIVSATFIVISGSGLLGGCCKSNCFLVLYCIFLVIIILAEAVFLALFLLPGTMIDDYIKTALREGLQFNNYMGVSTDNETSVITTLWVAIMDTLDCCGLDGSADFQQTKWWDIRDNMTVPIACCKNFTGALQELKSKDTGTDVNPECAENPWSNITNIDLGCYKAMKDKIFESQLSVGIFAGICVVIFLVEAVLFFSAVAVVKENLEKNKKVHPSPHRQRR